MKSNVYNIKKKKVGTVELPEDVFGVEVKEAVLWEQVKAQLASRRRGTHKTKKRGEVRGTGAKPFAQKGGGRHRQGSARDPSQVGGGTVFGPQPRDYSYRLPRSARRAALKIALSLRLKEEALVVLDAFEIEAPKTKSVIEILEKLGAGNALIVDAKNDNLKLSTQNLQKTKFLSADGINVYDILNHEKLLLTQAALESVIQRAKGEKTAETAPSA